MSGKKWLCNAEGFPDIHVLPVNDLRTHKESEYCCCEPRIEYEGNGRIIVHHAYDHREICEMENE